MTRDYAFDQSFAQERERLSAMESLWAAARRLAGASAIADRGANVTAIDIDTRFIEQFASDTIEVRRVDVRTDELPQSKSICPRPPRPRAPDRPAGDPGPPGRTLRPGGGSSSRIDWSCFGFEIGVDNTSQAIMGFMERAGFERDYGRRIVADLADAGFTDVRGEGRARVVGSRDPGFDFFRLSFESLRGTLVDSGELAKEDADAATSRFGEDMRVFTPLMVAGIGRRS